MTQTTITYYVGVVGRDERFQFGGGIRALIEAGDGNDKVSTRTNGLVDMIVHGGTGKDILELGSGADIIYGDNPNGIGGADGDPNIGNFDRDAILGGGNNDTIFSQGGDDVVDGENGDDYINGGVGNDFLQGGSGNDQVFGGAGNDTIYGGNAQQTLIPGLTIDLIWDGTTNTQLNGGLPVPIDSKATAISPALTNTGVDLLYGGDGNDTLSGQDGADLLDGGAGSDTAVYSSSAAININLNVEAQVSGGEAQGDRLVSIENVSATRFGDRITGNGAANILGGNGGIDVIAGGGGKDTLAGGPDKDFFVFDTALNASTNVDSILDFSHVDDSIRLENAIFKAVGAVGALAGARFFVGAAAHDGDDRIIYNKTTGQLFYDDDGTGAHGQILFAVLTTKPADVAASDFAII